MSLKAGRVGVAPSEVDEAGHIKVGGSSDAYTKSETDALLANKANKSYITANNKIFQFAYDSATQKYGYKAGAQGEFHPFDGAGGVVGMNLPDATMTGVTLSETLEFVEGGCQVTEVSNGVKILWVDFIVKRLPVSGSVLITFNGAPTLRYGVIISKGSTLENARNFICDSGSDAQRIDSNGYITFTFTYNHYARIIGAFQYTE